MAPQGKLKVGDVVRLKSGGPNMTVNDIIEQFSPDIECVWFPEGTTMQTARFSVEALLLVEDQRPANR